MRQSLFYILSAFAVFATSCSKKTIYNKVANVEEVKQNASRSVDKKEVCYCLENEHYLPREELAVLQDMKYVNSLFIFPNSSDLKNNWHGQESVKYAQEIIKQANHKLTLQRQMALPVGNNTPVYTIPWRYKLLEDKSQKSGYAVFDVVDDDLYYYISKGKYRNNSDMEIINKYGRPDVQALNVFAMPHHLDSVASPSYKPSSVGIALGNTIKIGGVRQHEIKNAWKMATLFNHEVGHVLGLRHSWYKNDGCDDTPPHPNCYSSKPDGDCAGVVSNNMMDYNKSQTALTPCQVSIATRYLHHPTSKARGLLLKDWCTYDTSKSLIVTDSVHINRYVDLKGDIVVKAGGHLKISCTVNMPAGSEIIVHPTGTLVLNGCTIRNDCGDTWSGIKLITKGKQTAALEQLGEIVLDDVAGAKY